MSQIDPTMIAAPCVRYGHCCRVAPCLFGEWDEEAEQCRFLEDDGEFQTRCGRYDEVMALPSSARWASPAFGAGCSSTLFNEDRDAVLRAMMRGDIILHGATG